MFKRLSVVVVALLLQFQCITARSQSAAKQESEHRKTSEPYTGDLSIFDSPGRDERLQINRVMDILGIASGKTVADIGAGSGWFTVRAAKRVGDTGTVYAVDINPEAIRYIELQQPRNSALSRIVQFNNLLATFSAATIRRNSMRCRARARAGG